jgi:hypothetical protein
VQLAVEEAIETGVIPAEEEEEPGTVPPTTSMSHGQQWLTSISMIIFLKFTEFLIAVPIFFLLRRIFKEPGSIYYRSRCSTLQSPIMLSFQFQSLRTLCTLQNLADSQSPKVSQSSISFVSVDEVEYTLRVGIRSFCEI